MKAFQYLTSWTLTGPEPNTRSNEQLSTYFALLVEVGEADPPKTSSYPCVCM